MQWLRFLESRILKFILLSLPITASFNSYSGVYDPSQIWEKGKISKSVCIYSPSTSDFLGKRYKDRYDVSFSEIIDPSGTIQDLVKQTVQDSYRSEMTKIEFDNFEVCSDSSVVDVVIFFTQNEHTGYGRVFDSDYDNFSLKPFLPDLSESTMPKPKGLTLIQIDVRNQNELLKVEFNRLKKTLLHEFGHVAGLQHEHSYFHKQAKKDPNCTKAILNFDKKWARTVSRTSLPSMIAPMFYLFKKGMEHYGPYDNMSIMNYCNVFRDTSPELSKGDIETLNFIYRNH